MNGRHELVKKIADEFEALVHAGKIEWVECDQDALPEKTASYVRMMLDDAGVSYKVATAVLDGTYFFMLDDPLIGYLHHDPVGGTHMWICKNFKLCLDNHAAFNYFTALKVENEMIDYASVHSFNQVLKSKQAGDDNGQ